MRLSKKRALVTGAASGIGEAVVSAFLNEGSEVFGADLSYSANSPERSTGFTPMPLDISKEDAWERLMETIAPIDILAPIIRERKTSDLMHLHQHQI